MLMDTLPLSAATAGLKLSWASASAAAASAAAAVLPLCGPPAGVAVLLISAETAFSAVGQLSFADIWKLLVDEGSAASVLEEAIDDQICIVEEEEEEVKASALRASAPEWKPSTVTEEPMQQAPCQPLSGSSLGCTSRGSQHLGRACARRDAAARAQENAQPVRS